MSDAPSLLLHTLFGATSGVLAMAITYPLDRLLTMSQLTAQQKCLSSDPNCLKVMYKGLCSTLLATGVSWSSFFLVYESLKRWGKYKGKSTNIYQNLLYGSIAGTVSSFCANPFWVLSCHMKVRPLPNKKKTLGNDIEEGKAGKNQEEDKKDEERGYEGTSEEEKWAGEKIGEGRRRGEMRRGEERSGEEGMIREMHQILSKNQGFNGLLPSLLLVANPAIQFAIFDAASKIFHKKFNKKTAALLLGAVSKFIATILTYPLQVVKTHMQANRKSSPSDGIFYAEYQNLIKTLKNLINFSNLRETIQKLSAGLGTKLFLTVTTSSLMFYILERLYILMQVVRTVCL